MISCEGQTIVLPLMERRILVEEQLEPMFIITGYSNLTRMVYEFELGLRVFHDIRIFARSQPLEDEEDDDEDDMSVEEGGASMIKAAKLAQKFSKKMMEREW